MNKLIVVTQFCATTPFHSLCHLPWSVLCPKFHYISQW